MTTTKKNEIRSTLSTTVIRRTGTLTVTQVVDLDALGEQHGDMVPLEALKGAGFFEVTLERVGKTKRVALTQTVDEADFFVAGFRFCADVRKRKAKRKGAES